MILDTVFDFVSPEHAAFYASISELCPLAADHAKSHDFLDRAINRITRRTNQEIIWNFDEEQKVVLKSRMANRAP